MGSASCTHGEDHTPPGCRVCCASEGFPDTPSRQQRAASTSWVGGQMPLRCPGSVSLHTRRTAGGSPVDGAHRTAPWCLGRSCPCYFRLLCDETNMVHFFSGDNSRLEELAAPEELLGRGPGVTASPGIYTADSPSSTACWRVRGQSVSGHLLSSCRPCHLYEQVQLVRPRSHARVPGIVGKKSPTSERGSSASSQDHDTTRVRQ